MYDPERLTQTVTRILAGSDTELLLSHATLWEVLAKLARGNLLLAGETMEDAYLRMQQLGLEMLAITEAHIVQSAQLPRYHSDPFDRMLVAQAIGEGASILSSDRVLSRYDVAVIWA